MTKRATAETKRLYDDACGTAHGLELVGDRWTLLLLRELMYGPRRFSDLKRDMLGISANVLSQRLEELERRGLLSKVRLPPPAARDAYRATEWGLEVKPVIMELGRFAARSPGHDPTLPLSPVSIMMSFETMIDAGQADGFSGRIGLVLNDEPFIADVQGPAITVSRGAVDACPAVITGTPEVVAGVVYGGAPVEMLAFAGDEALARRFLTLFTLPPKVDARPG
ncbi:hypothetical protein GCM10022280_00440 [Sphingomonas swuensis]|uniref:HTH hxlR-type domain-containing protein n=1 Tax=Sphingomonas swuensis TaxID=977800 RepID=A0ABP7S870_9SPHN